MAHLWLIPADDPYFERTLAEPIDITEAPNKPPNFPNQARIWGVRADPDYGTWHRNSQNLERMASGDPLLIYRTETSRYEATGRVGEFWHTEWVRDEFWDGAPSIDVYSVEKFEEIDVGRSTVNEMLGYKTRFWPQGLWRVSNNRPKDRVIGRFDI